MGRGSGCYVEFSGLGHFSFGGAHFAGTVVGIAVAVNALRGTGLSRLRGLVGGR